jgi:hypothetical protein
MKGVNERRELQRETKGERRQLDRVL